MAGMNLFKFFSWQGSPEFPPMIDGTKKPSFCYTTINERWPKIVTKLVDQLHQYQHEAVNLYGSEGDADVKLVISKLSEMRYLMMTDKPLQNMIENDRFVSSFSSVWNKQLEEYRRQNSPANVTWYKAPWLFVECYLYAKIIEFFSETVYLREYDPFKMEKERAFVDSQAHMLAIGTEVVKVNARSLDLDEKRRMLVRLLQIVLWGNKCDLSLSGGDPHFMSETIFHELEDLRANILVDDLDKACNSYFFRSDSKLTRLDIVLDNAGLELFTDLCLADFAVSHDLVEKVVLHGKTFPWFVSDVTKKDLDWVLDQLSGSEDEYLSKLGSRWTSLVMEGKFVYKADPFWTQGFAYCEMKHKAPELYAELQSSSFLIFKGDLNYRKLVGDRYWAHDTPFKTALCGFQPAPLLALRTLKAETLAGLSQEAVQLIRGKYKEGDLSWMVSSDYAVAQMFIP